MPGGETPAPTGMLIAALVLPSAIKALRQFDFASWTTFSWMLCEQHYGLPSCPCAQQIANIMKVAGVRVGMNIAGTLPVHSMSRSAALA